MCKNDINNQNEINDFDFCESTFHNNNDCTVPAEPQLEVHSNSQQSQQHDQDVAVVYAEQQLEIHCDRQQLQQHDMDVAAVPAEQQLEVQCDRQQLQQHDMDVAMVPAEQQLEVLSVRQHDNDVAMVSAEQQLKIYSDRQQQQQQQTVSVLANSCVEEYLHVNGIGKGATIGHSSEKHSQLLDCNNTPNRLPTCISKITQLTINMSNNNYHLYARKISCPVEGFFI